MKDWQALHNGVLFWLARPPIRGQVVRQVTSTTALTVRDRQLWWGKELTEPPQGRVASMHRHMGPNARFHLAPCRVWRGAAGQGVRTVCLPRMSAPDLRPVDRRRRPNGAGRPSEFIAHTRPVEAHEDGPKTGSRNSVAGGPSELLEGAAYWAGGCTRSPARRLSTFGLQGNGYRGVIRNGSGTQGCFRRTSGNQPSGARSGSRCSGSRCFCMSHL